MLGRNCLLLLIVILFFSSGLPLHEKKHIEDETEKYSDSSLYKRLQLWSIGLKKEAFEKAMMGWEKLKAQQQLSNLQTLSIVDLSQSSNNKRLYIIDLEKEKVLFNTYVAHGRNSGEEFATSFSNIPTSYQSSLGFYITGDSYIGKHGLSLLLKGIEQGFNDAAEKRAIVMHGAKYVSDLFIQRYGRLGRSLGCPAVPEELCDPIINSLKKGSCLFVYYPDKNYLRESAL